VFNGSTGLEAKGVQCLDEKGKLRTYTASQEVILSAGAFGTPKLLMYSGVGPRNILTQFGIPVKVNSPLVGQTFRNQPNIGMTVYDPSIVNPNILYAPNAEGQYSIDGTGAYSVQLSTLVSLKVNASHPTADFGLAFYSPSLVDLFQTNFSLTLTLAYYQYSEGAINLTSRDPLSSLVFSPNLWQHEDDVNTLVNGILETRKIIAKWPAPGLIELFPGPSYNTTAQLQAIVRQYGFMTCHFYHSVTIGNTTNPLNSPLDRYANVNGVKKLRVADSSAVPALISLGQQVTAVVMGERISDLIIAGF